MNLSFWSSVNRIHYGSCRACSLCMIGCFTMVFVLCLFGVQPVHASERHFAFTYEAQVHAPGEKEYEQSVTWKTDKQDDSSFDRLDFRHEFEFGITENFQLAFYVSDWRYEDGKSVADDGANWRNVGIEGIYKLTDANADGFGSAVYGEIKAGDRLLALEGKLILQKNYGKIIAAYNFVLEAVWEGSHLEKDKGEVKNIFGLSYQLHPTMNIGAELVHEIAFDHWSQAGHNIVYLGPNISYRRSGWWMTIAPLFQVSHVDSEADFMTRLLVGIDF